MTWSRPLDPPLFRRQRICVLDVLHAFRGHSRSAVVSLCANPQIWDTGKKTLDLWRRRLYRRKRNEKNPAGIMHKFSEMLTRQTELALAVCEVHRRKGCSCGSRQAHASGAGALQTVPSFDPKVACARHALPYSVLHTRLQTSWVHGAMAQVAWRDADGHPWSVRTQPLHTAQNVTTSRQASQTIRKEVAQWAERASLSRQCQPTSGPSSYRSG